MLIDVDGPWKVRTRSGRVQGRNPLAGARINDCDLPGVRPIDEDPGARLVELEALRMALERYIGNLTAARRIDHRKCPLAIADHNCVAPPIDAGVGGGVGALEA